MLVPLFISGFWTGLVRLWNAKVCHCGGAVLLPCMDYQFLCWIRPVSWRTVTESQNPELEGTSIIKSNSWPSTVTPGIPPRAWERCPNVERETWAQLCQSLGWGVFARDFLCSRLQVQGENPELWTGDVWPDLYLVLTGMQGLHPSVWQWSNPQHSNTPWVPWGKIVSEEFEKPVVCRDICELVCSFVRDVKVWVGWRLSCSAITGHAN